MRPILLVFVFFALNPFFIFAAENGRTDASSQSSSIVDPFNSPPQESFPNGNETYFEYEIKINSNDDFLAFLKAHQDDGILHSDHDSPVKYKYPTKEKLLPGYIFHNSKFFPDIKLDLNNYKGKVEILEVKDSSRQNKLVYALEIDRYDFKEKVNLENWNIRILMSNNGNLFHTFVMGK